MTPESRFAKRLDDMARKALEQAIRVMRDACDDAERAMKHPGYCHVAAVLARLSNGHRNAMAHIESAVSSLSNKITCLEVELGVETATEETK